MRRELLLLIPFCCSSCAVAPVLRLTSLHPGSTWTRGHMEAAKSADSLMWRVAFEGTERNDLVFLVCVGNGSMHPRFVDPNALSCMIDVANGSVPRRLAHAIPARDPERVLRAVSSHESSILADRRTADLFDALTASLEAGMRSGPCCCASWTVRTRACSAARSRGNDFGAHEHMASPTGFE